MSWQQVEPNAENSATLMRALTSEELDDVQGGWVPLALMAARHAGGAAAGAVAGGLSAYIATGGDWHATSRGALVNGAYGLVSPATGFRKAAELVALSVGTAYLGKAYDSYSGK